MLEKLMGRYTEIKSKDKKGFTLIELVIVIVIIAILALIMVPNITSYIAKSRQSKAEANLRSMYTSIQLVEQTEGLASNEVLGSEKLKEHANVSDDEIAKYSYENGVLTYKDGDVTVTFDGTKFGPDKGPDKE